VASNEREARVISNGRQQQVAMIDRAVGVASTVQGEAVSIDPAVEADPIWIARLRTGRVVTFRVSGSRAFRAAALIDPVAAVDLAVIASAAAEALAAVIASVEAVDLGALAGLAAVVGSEVGAEN
jgi:hypothetical protein